MDTVYMNQIYLIIGSEDRNQKEHRVVWWYLHKGKLIQIKKSGLPGFSLGEEDTKKLQQNPITLSPWKYGKERPQITTNL